MFGGKRAPTARRRGQAASCGGRFPIAAIVRVRTITLEGRLWVAAPLGVALAVLACAPAAARRPAIEGRVAASGFEVVALAPDGRTRAAAARRDFELVPPARTVTLHLRDARGEYAGPVVVAGRGPRAVVRVRAGARLGTIRVYEGYARSEEDAARRRRGRGHAARANRGVPIGAGRLGLVRATARGPVGPGHDRDSDGIPGLWDVDDDGDLIADSAERRRSRTGSGLRPAGGLRACVEPVCSGRLTLAVSSLDEVDTEVWVALVAALLAAASLGWQLGGALGRRRGHRIDVDARLGLPVYSQGGGRWAIFIEVTNDSEHPIRWVSAALELRDGRALYLMDHPPAGDLPAVIQPHDSHHTWVDCAEVERQGVDLRQPMAAAVKLATGEVVRSRTRRLVERRWRGRR
jgi:hypothetical protein